MSGASSGLGKGAAEKFADEGAHVVVAARRTELLDQLAADCQRRGGAEALAVTTHVANAQDVARLAQATVDEFGRIDVWINDAAVGAITPFWAAPLEDYSRLIDINFKGVVYGSHAPLRQFGSAVGEAVERRNRHRVTW